MRKMTTTGVQPTHDTPNDRELEKLSEFTQVPPDRRDFERAANPPILPPHLLQVRHFRAQPSVVEPIGDSQQRHARAMRPERASGAEPRHAQPPLRTLHQGRCDGAQRNASTPQEIRHHAALQAHLSHFRLHHDPLKIDLRAAL